MIWQDMSILEKQELIIEYNNIKKQLLRLKGNRSHYSKEEYDQKVLELQNLYNNVLLQYRCDNCKKIINLDLKKSKLLFKGETNPIFCNVKCSGQYYSILQHSNESMLQRKRINEKISNTLLLKQDKTEESKKLKINTKINTKIKTKILNEEPYCKYCGKLIDKTIISIYQLNRFNKGFSIYCSKQCSTASRYGKGEAALAELQLVEQIKYYIEETELNYTDIVKKLRSIC